MDVERCITTLISTSFLKRNIVNAGKPITCLATPVIINIPKEISANLLEKYNPQVEVGGVLLAFPRKQNGSRILDVNNIIFLENLSTTPEKEFSRPDFKDDITSIWTRSLSKDERICLPIFFHSHPDITSNETLDLERWMLELSPITTSEADKQFASSLMLPIDGQQFFVPNALVVQSEIGDHGTIIAFFGGGITPTDFKEYMLKLTGKTLEEIGSFLKSWVKEDPNRSWILIVFGILVMIPIVLYPKRAIPIILILILIAIGTQIVPLVRQNAENLPNYFNSLGTEDMMINIPRYES